MCIIYIIGSWFGYLTNPGTFFTDNFRNQKTSGAFVLLRSILRSGGVWTHTPILLKCVHDSMGDFYVIIDGNHRVMLMVNTYLNIFLCYTFLLSLSLHFIFGSHLFYFDILLMRSISTRLWQKKWSHLMRLLWLWGSLQPYTRCFLVL